MKYLKKFENFSGPGQDLGRFSDEEENISKLNLGEDDEDCAPCNDDEEVNEIPGGEWVEDDSTEEEKDEEEENRIRRWGDEVVEKKKVNAGFQAYLDKQKAKKGDKKEDKKEKELAAKYPPKDKITKGDFIAAAIENKKGKKADNKKEEEKEESKGKKGLTAGQKKLPEAMQKAILKKQK